MADLKLRVIEHNVLVVSKYYTRITTTRLAELLDLKPEEVSRRHTVLSVSQWQSLIRSVHWIT